ncbi:hypothetical protein F4859DRAFT_478449 [Xylaria cf. heliscus]|nr:hypothetical protein F4859DRAFT_478449 [Xylaria cf. heliscus]
MIVLTESPSSAFCKSYAPYTRLQGECQSGLAGMGGIKFWMALIHHAITIVSSWSLAGRPEVKGRRRRGSVGEDSELRPVTTMFYDEHDYAESRCLSQRVNHEGMLLLKENGTPRGKFI